MTRITDERLAELADMSQNVADVLVSRNLQVGAYPDIAAALRELQYRRTENERLRTEREDLSRRVHELEKHATEVAHAFHRELQQLRKAGVSP